MNAHHTQREDETEAERETEKDVINEKEKRNFGKPKNREIMRE